MELKPGYKQTELGVIPEEWEDACLCTFGSVIDGDRGSNYPNGDDFKSGGFCLFLNAGNVTKDGFKFSDCAFITQEKDAQLNKGKLKRNDVVLTTRGTVGNFALYDQNVPYEDIRINSGMVILRNESETLDTTFLYTFLRSQLTQTQIERLSFGSAQPQLTVKGISNFRVIIPPLPEQRAIATALSDVDALIASLDKLIAKKRDMKQAAMQELLTAKRRLPWFSGEWEEVRLSSISKEPMQNGVFYKPSLKGAGVKLINVGDLYSCTPINSDSLELFNASSTEIERFRVEDGDLFFTRSSVVPSGIAHCNMYCACGDEDIVFDSHVIRFRPDKLKASPDYLFRYLTGATARQYLVSHAKTATMTTIDQGVLGKCPVILPPLPEQTAIAAILSDMDAEIASLEQKRDKTRLLKQGMMQELLTGRIRLV